MQLKEGSELQNGKYRIIRVLGQGGFGITYLAESIFFEKYVAIKEFFPKDFCGRENTSHLSLGTQNNAETVSKLKDRFLKEAKNIAKLDHPGIIKIHDIFEENNTAYYVMDYIEGENLNEMVKRNGPLSEAKAVAYIRKVGDALDYIHSRNMTHFDVKPANIMVRKKDDQPILIDFGLSKQYDAHGDATSTLMQGVSQGYSPIELYNPGSISSFSPQTDVYSLGATLYFLLTGTVPPVASDILENGLIVPSHISDTNSKAIQTAMAVSRSKRPQNVSYLTDKLSFNYLDENSSQQSSNCSNSFLSSDEDTVLFENDANASNQDVNKSIPDSNTEVQEDDNEEFEPTFIDKLITNVSSTNCLNNTFSISKSKKIFYFITHLSLIFLSLPLGWIFWIALFNKLKGALKKLFFPNNISEFDEGSDYSKAKCWGVISIPIIVILLEGVFILWTIQDNRSNELKQYITEFNARAPYFMMEAQITSMEYDNDNIIFNCISSNSHANRQYINKLNINLWKPILAYEDSTINKDKKIKKYIFRFKNENGSFNDITVPVLELYEYEQQNEVTKASDFLHSYISLEKEFTPYKIQNGIILKDVSLSKSGSGFGTRNCLKYTFEDSDGLLSNKTIEESWKTLEKNLPLRYPYLLESIDIETDGISFQIDSNEQKGNEILVFLDTNEYAEIPS